MFCGHSFQNPPKRPIDKDVYGTKLESNSKHTSEANYQTTEAKRRKKTNDALNDTQMEVKGHLQTNEMASENAASVSYHLETKSEKPQLNMKMSPCVFCHSSKETEVCSKTKLSCFNKRCFCWGICVFR